MCSHISIVVKNTQASFCNVRDILYNGWGFNWGSLFEEEQEEAILVVSDI